MASNGQDRLGFIPAPGRKDGSTDQDSRLQEAGRASGPGTLSHAQTHAARLFPRPGTPRPPRVSRRGGPSLILAAFSRGPRAVAAGGGAPRQARFFFTSQGKTGLVNADGSGLRYFDFDKPGQATWQVGATFPDGRARDLPEHGAAARWPGRPFDEYYTQTPTHLWVHDLETGSLEEICARDRLAPFVTPALLLGGDRLLVQVVRKKVGQIFSVRPRRDRRTRVHPRRRGAPLRAEPQPRRPAGRLSSRGSARAIRSGPATPTGRTESASPPGRDTSTSARAGRRTAAGSSTSTAIPTRTRGTTGRTSVSAARTAESIGC